MELYNKLMEHPENVISFLALLTSIVSILYTARSLGLQRKHNYLSVKPIAAIEFGDYEDDIYIRICNNGLGPMLIKKVTVWNESLSGSNIIDLLPENIRLETVWNTFVGKVAGQSIKVDHHLTILQKKFTTDNTITPQEDQLKQNLRGALKPLHIKILYTDIYEKSEYEVERNLTWFGRTLQTRSPISSINTEQ